MSGLRFVGHAVLAGIVLVALIVLLFLVWLGQLANVLRRVFQ
jgi:hypothetical protein